MTRTTPLHEALLELGLEDWIPLPEIFATPEVRSIIDSDRATEMVSLALVDLLRQGQIQVWAGRWPDEPTLVSEDLAESMLLDGRRYSFDAEASGLERVFFVNVKNFSAQ
ncbi:MAG TPA: hypothetical protein VIK32_02520 [Candidatus Limnocylindrales bacterium]